MQEEENTVCALCNNVARKRCSGCQSVYYCSQEHQKSHWKIHSKNCRVCKLVENSEIGRHYIATRDIKVGEVVIYDKAPLVTGPDNLYIDTINGENGATPPVCLSCYIELTEDNAKACENCGWPLCLKCTKHGGECEFTIKYRKSKVCITEYKQSHPGYLAIPVIRALALRDTKPEAYRKLLSLEDHRFKMSMKSYAEIPHKVASFIKGFFKVQHVKEVEIARIFRIILVNAYCVKIPQLSYGAVYDQASFMKHDCRANCSKTFTLEGGMMFWAALPISKGDHITTCYVDFYNGTLFRRCSLSDLKFFDCNCERCKDPTEFGTMFNAFKCINSACNGYMLPLMFTMSGHSNFVCRKCNTEIPNKKKKILDEAINEAWTWTKTQKNDVSQCRKFLKEWKSVLHENHFLNVDVETRMALKIGYAQNMADQSNDCHIDLLRLCKKLTGILQIIAPAEHCIIGLLLYLKCKLTIELNGRLYPMMTLDQAFAICRAVKKDYQEVYRLLRREPADSLEHSIAIRTHNEILKMEGLDKKLVERRISFG